VKGAYSGQGKWGSYGRDLASGSPVIKLDIAAKDGTLLEELIHHMQVQGKLSSGFTQAQVDVWVKSNRAAIERQAASIMRAHGYTRVPI
jgi:hypothetical protein